MADGRRRADAVLGCFLAAAVGDAMGAATEKLTRDQIRDRHPGMLDRFLTPTTENHAAGNMAGQITDDASQLAALAEYLIGTGGGIDVTSWTRALRSWALTSPQRYLMGPTTRAALTEPGQDANVQLDADGVPVAGRTNGAAMRVAPIGLLELPTTKLMAAARDSALPTHNSPVAVAAACAIAAGVAAAAKSSPSVEAVVDACRSAATDADRFFRSSTAGLRLADDIGHAVDLTAGRDHAAVLDIIASQIGTSVLAEDSIPAAVAVFAVSAGDPFDAAVLGINVGGDTDTIATMAAAMAGAFSGPAVIDHLVPELSAANHIDFTALAHRFVVATDRGGEP